MILSLATRMWSTSVPRLLWKFGYNFGFKGMRSVQRFKKRLKKGEVFPPFIYISILNSCNLRCTGCWVDVAHPQQKISFEELDRLITSAKKHGNSFFGLLGGEPFLHPDLIRILEAHPDCYFQIFTNGQYITDEMAAELRRVGNATPLISIEGTEIISDERRGRPEVLSKTLEGLEACTRNKLIVGVATSVCANNIDDLVRDEWVDELIRRGVHYVWFHTYRAVGPDPRPKMAGSRALAWLALCAIAAAWAPAPEGSQDGAVGDNCWLACGKKAGKCFDEETGKGFCGKKGVWSGSCCRAGAVGAEHAPECGFGATSSRGCSMNHCCIDDASQALRKKKREEGIARRRREEAEREEAEERAREAEKEARKHGRTYGRKERGIEVERRKKREERRKQRREERRHGRL